MRKYILFSFVLLLFGCNTQNEKPIEKHIDGWKETLVQTAVKARKNAYCPYSHFQVGSALLTEDGEIFSGVNIENAAYSITNCAERTALFTSVAAGHQKIKAIAISAKGIASPCGACRQALNEFNPDMIVILTNENGTHTKETTLSQLLSYAFGPKNLEQATPR